MNVRKGLKWFIKLQLKLLLLGILLLCFLLFTQWGLKLDYYLMKTFIPGKLNIAKIEGHLLGRFQLSQIDYQSKESNIKLKNITVDWSLAHLFSKGLYIREITVDKGKITSLKNNKNKTPTKIDNNFFKNLEKKIKQQEIKIQPILFKLDKLTITNIDFIQGKQTTQLKALLLQAEMSYAGFFVNQFDLKLNNTHISATGSLDNIKGFPIHMTLKSQGLLTANLNISGLLSDFSITGEITKPYQSHVKINIAGFSSIKGILDIKYAYYPITGQKLYQLKNTRLQFNSQVLTLNYQLNTTFRFDDLPWLSVTSQGSIDPSKLAIKSFMLKDQSASAKLQGQVNFLPQLKWQFSASTQSLNLAHFYKPLDSRLNLKITSEGMLSRGHIVDETSIQGHGRFLKAPLTLKGKFYHQKESNLHIKLSNNHLSLSGIYQKQLKINADLPSLHSVSSELSPIRIPIKISAILGSTIKGNLNVSKGFIELSPQQKIPVESATIDVQRRQNTIISQGLIKLDSNTHAKFKLLLPINFHHWSLKSQTFNGNINVYTTNMQVLDNIIDDVNQTKGELTANVTLSGKILKPRFYTQAVIKNASTTISLLGLKLHNVNLNLKGENNQWQVNGNIESNEGKLNVKGQADLRKGAFNSSLSLTGHDIMLINTSEYKIKASPNIVFNSHNDEMHLSGEIDIPYARITPSLSDSTIDLPDDVVIINQDNSITQKTFGYVINAKLGKDVKLDLLGLTGNITGGIRIAAPAHQMARADGTLKIINGKYQAYGQDLVINKGEINYTGGLLKNPNINLTATRRFKVNSSNFQGLGFDAFSDFDNYLTVGLRANGSLQSPNVTLFSNPPSNNQADILSMLLLGRPISKVNDSDSAMLFDAISSLNIGSGNGPSITKQLSNALGVDALSIEDDSLTDAPQTGDPYERTALVVSKSLSPKLSLHYSIGLLTGTSILRIRFKLGKKWTLQTETDGQSNGIDVLYHYQRQ